MKHNLSRTFRSVTSMILVLSMIFGLCGTAIAATVEDGDKTEINYVSLGDSMTNGYGLDGYDGNNGVEDYGEGSYANLFADWLAKEYDSEVNHAQLAMSAMRAEDLHWLLELDYENDDAIAVTDGDWDEEAWNAMFTTGDYWTWNELCDDYRFSRAAYAIKNGGYTAADDKAEKKITEKEAAIVAEYYQTSVKNADVISLGMGNGNFGVFMFGRITEAIGFDGVPDDAMIYKVENAIRELDPEMQKAVLDLIDELKVVVSEYVVIDDGDDETTSSMEALVNTVVYTAISYVLNYAGSVEAILQLNPTADIILVGLMNTFADSADDETEEISIGDLLQIVFTPLNAFIAALPTYMQATNNSVYANANFYYAEAADVECMVEVYGDDFYIENEDEELIPNPNSTIRDRFVTDVIGTAGELGMVWDLLADVELIGGIKLIPVTFEEICAYDAMNDTEKAAYAAVNKEQAVSIAVYLAFEDAIVTSAKTGKAVTLESVLGLGGLDASLFSGVMTSFMANIGDASRIYIDTASGVVAAGSQEQLTAEQVKTLVTGGDSAIYAAVAAQIGSNATAVEQNYGGVPEITNAVDALKTAVDSANMLCMLLALPDTLSSAVQGEPALAGLLGLFARCVVGHGLGGHPSEAGHDALFEAVRDAYENGYTAQDQTIANAKAALEAVAALVAEYYDEAYAYAYEYADDNGYIEIATAAIDSVIAELKAIDLSDTQMTDAFKAEVAGEIEEIIETLEAAKALILEADVLDQDALDALMAMLDEGGEAIENLLNVLAQAGEDVTNLVVIPALEAAKEKLENEIIPELKTKLEAAIKAGTEWLMVKLDESYNAFVEAARDAIAEYGPKAAEWIYNYLLNNPEEVIAFVQEYGPYAAEFVEKYSEEILMVLGFLATNYGEDVVEYIIENHKEILETMCYLVSEYGDEAWALIEVYAEATGLTDLIKDKLDTISNEVREKLEAQLEALEAQLEVLKAQLEVKLEELKNAAEEVKAEIEKAIAEIEAAIEKVEQAIEEAKAAIEELKAEIEKTIDEIEKEIKAAAEALIKAIEAELEALKAQLEVKLEELKNAAEEVKAEIEKAIAELKAVIAEVEKALEDAKEIAAQIKAEIEKTVAEIEKEIKDAVEKVLGNIKTVLEEKFDELEEILGEAKTEIEKIIGDFVSALDAEIKNAIEGTLEELGEKLAAILEDAGLALEEKLALIGEELAGVVNDVFEILANEALSVWDELYYDATHGELTIDNDTYYVSIGDSSATDMTDSEEDNSFSAKFAAALGLDLPNQYKSLAEIDLTVGDVRYILDSTFVPDTYTLEIQEYLDSIREEYIAEIEKADIITVSLGSDNINTFVFAQLDSIMTGATPCEMDWSRYVGEEGVAYVAEALAEIKEEIAAMGLDASLAGMIPGNMTAADLIAFMVECYAYGYVSFSFDYAEVLNDIHEINPDAEVIVIGMYNPMDAMALDLNGETVVIGEYVDYFVELVDLQYVIYTMLTPNTTYVEIPDTETILDTTLDGAEAVPMTTYLYAMLKGGSTLQASEAGHEYIKDQILDAFAIINNVCKHEGGEATCTDKAVCNLCGREYGDVDAENHVNTEIINATKPGCDEEGYTGDTYCNDCDNVVAKGEVIPATGEHVDDNDAWESGVDGHFHTCGVCGKIFDKTPHANTEVRGATEPGCDEEGYTGDTYCVDCGILVAEGEAIPATGEHVDDNNAWEISADGHFHTCGVCGKIFDKAPHANTEVRGEKAADYTNEGYTGDTYCVDCGVLIAEGEVIPALGVKIDLDALAGTGEDDYSSIILYLDEEHKNKVTEPSQLKDGATVYYTVDAVEGYVVVSIGATGVSTITSEYFVISNLGELDLIPEYALAGDFDMNGTVNILDAIWMVRYIVGWKDDADMWTITECDIAGDTDADGQINTLDAINLAKSITGHDVEMFPSEQSNFVAYIIEE